MISNRSNLFTGYKIVSKECLTVRSVTSVFGFEDVVTVDCRIADWILGSKSNLLTLQQNEIISPSDSYWAYRRYVHRILLNPSIELQNVIYNNKRLLFTRKYVLGVQVRMGAWLADFHEIAQMMTMDQLRAYPNTIVTMMQKWNYDSNNTVIYLSTDSTYAENYIRQKLGPDYEIGVAKTFKRSHSRTSALGNDEPLKNALVDLYLLADTDALIVCKDSAFGRAVISMTRARHTLVYKVTHSLLVNFNGTNGLCQVERDVIYIMIVSKQIRKGRNGFCSPYLSYRFSMC